jgi:PST family polysaccharide transporter
VGSLGRRAAAALLARTVVMRGVTALGTVALARILAPADFGVYAVLVLLQTVLSFFADFGLGPSLVQQERDPTRQEMATAWFMQQLLWVVCVAAIWIVAPLVGRLFPSLGPDFQWQLRLLSLSIAFTLIRSLPSAMLVRVLRFPELASIDVVAHVVFYATAVVLAMLGAGVWSFAVALTLQNATAAILTNLAWRHWPGFYFSRAIAGRLLRFGVAFQAANVANALRDGVVPLFGGLAGGVAAIGYLQFSLRVSQLTSSVNEIIARVMFPSFSRIKQDAERTARVLLDAILLVCILIGGTQAWIIATAPFLVPIVFGDQWTVAVPALQLMCVGVLTSVPSRVAGSVVFGQGRAKIGLLVTLAGVALLFALFGPLVLLLGLVGGGLAYAIAGGVGLYLQSWAIRPVARFPWPNLLRVYLLAGIAGLASWLVAAHVAGIIGLSLSAAVFGAIDLALLWLFARTDLTRAWRLIGTDHSRLLSGMLSRADRLRGAGRPRPTAGDPTEHPESPNLNQPPDKRVSEK